MMNQTFTVTAWRFFLLKKESIIFRGDDNSYYEKSGANVVNIDDEIPFELPDNWAWCRGYACFEGMESTRPQGDYFDYIDILLSVTGPINMMFGTPINFMVLPEWFRTIGHNFCVAV